MNEPDRVTPLPVSNEPPSDEASLELAFARTEHAALDRATPDRSQAREHAHVALALGLRRLTDKRFDDALAKLERAVKIFSAEATPPPELFHAHLGAAEAQARTGFDELARRHLRDAKRILRKVPPSDERDELVSALTRATERVSSLPSEPVHLVSAEPPKRYRHAKFGDGTLIDRRDNNLHVRFDDGAERWLVADRLTLLGV